MSLYDYQIKLKNDIIESLRRGSKATLATLPTGGGKTMVMANIAAGFDAPLCMIAHRQELVSQISLATARAGIYHRIIAPENVVRFIVNQHIKESGRSYYKHNAQQVVTGVDTIIRRTRELATWMQSVRLWQMDEGHHVQMSNKWGRAVAAFPNAQGIGWTATPLRGDGKSLKLGDGGCYEDLVVGPGMRDLINLGRLSKFKIFGPEHTIDLSEVGLASDGDYNQNQLRKAVHRSKIVGDIVQEYLNHARGLLGITFVVDVEAGNETVAAYRAAGVSAHIITANTPVNERGKLMEAFKRREFLQLVNVDICGEGTDIPAVEVISMARPSASFPLVMQQFGRVVRVHPGKTHGIIIDHAGNIVRMAQKYGLPDDDFQWSLDLPPKRKRLISNERLKTCLGCRSLFLAHLKICPECGMPVIAQGKGKPELCDGDMTEYSSELLDSLRRQATNIMRRIPHGKTARDRAVYNSWEERRENQETLREAISWFGGSVTWRGLSDSEGQRLFFRTFGVDVLSAQSLGAREAADLAGKIYLYLTENKGL
jgi:DNA repair protein RadD